MAIEIRNWVIYSLTLTLFRKIHAMQFLKDYHALDIELQIKRIRVININLSQSKVNQMELLCAQPERHNESVRTEHE